MDVRNPWSSYCTGSEKDVQNSLRCYYCPGSEMDLLKISELMSYRQ